MIVSWNKSQPLLGRGNVNCVRSDKIDVVQFSPHLYWSQASLLPGLRQKRQQVLMIQAIRRILQKRREVRGCAHEIDGIPLASGFFG
jgi:hypothetical protein